MKIVSAECFVVEIPFHDGSSQAGITPRRWHTLEMPLIRLEDERGNIGWGDGFGYFTADAVRSMVDQLIVPTLVGATIEDIPQWNHETQRRLHIFGRYGVTMFAISAVDIALWDLRARREDLPLHRLLAKAGRSSVPIYASLVRYGNDSVGIQMMTRALKDGFGTIKLHETDLDHIRVFRREAGDDVPLAVDVNCYWQYDEARKALPQLADINIAWLEEPIFPPEDFERLATLRNEKVPLACGENWCTAFQFEVAMRAQAVDRVQPSVTKVGGISEYLAVIRHASAHGVNVLPHTPYFGPGFLASLHLAAAFPEVMQLEYHYVEPEAWLLDIRILLQGGQLHVPEGPGLGMTPDPDVLARYARR